MSTETRNGIVNTYTYNDAGLVLSTGEDFELEYSLDGNQTKRTYDNGKTVTYSYDGIGRLISEQNGNDTTSYSYDSRGNRVKMTKGGVVTDYDYTRSNQLKYESVSENGSLSEKTTYNYDNNGNMIFKGHEKYVVKNGPESVGIYVAYGTGDEELSVFYTYDSRNRLIGVDSETTQAAYTYDALGRRSSKTVNGDTTKHIWSGSEIVEDTDADGGVKAKYYRGINPVATVTKTAGEATVYYYRYDEKGSVTSMSGSGGIALSYEYDAFGNQTEAEGDVYNPYRYTGEYYDEETGFVYLRNRYYDPSIGRFTQEDPAKDGANWYVYCGNNPVSFVDPLGLWMDGDENLSSQAQLYTTYYGNKWDEANNIYNRCLRAGNLEGAAEAQKMMDELHNLANDIRSLDAEGKVFGAWFKGITDIDQQKRNICYAAVSLMIYNWATGSNYTYDDAVAYDQAYLEFNDKETEGGKVPNNINIRNVQYDPDSEYVGIVASKIQEAQMPLAAEFNAFEEGVQQDMGHVVLLSGAAYAPGHDPIVDFIDSAELSFDGIYTLKEFESLPSAASSGAVTYELRQITVPSVAGIKSYIDMIGGI